MLSEGRTWRTIQREIEECEVRCANRQRRRTARQFGWSKLAPVAQLDRAPVFGTGGFCRFEPCRARRFPWVAGLLGLSAGVGSAAQVAVG